MQVGGWSKKSYVLCIVAGEIGSLVTVNNT